VWLRQADDVMLPNHIDTCVEAFHRAPDLGVLRTVSGAVN
jgi:hypothetical protein